MVLEPSGQTGEMHRPWGTGRSPRGDLVWAEGSNLPVLRALLQTTQQITEQEPKASDYSQILSYITEQNSRRFREIQNMSAANKLKFSVWHSVKITSCAKKQENQSHNEKTT